MKKLSNRDIIIVGCCADWPELQDEIIKRANKGVSDDWFDVDTKNPTVKEEKYTKIKDVELWHGVNDERALQKLPNGKYLLTPKPGSDMQKLWFVPAWNSESKRVALGYANYAMVRINIPFEFSYAKVTKKDGSVSEHTESYKPIAPKWERSYQVQEWYLYDGALELNPEQVKLVDEFEEDVLSLSASCKQLSKRAWGDDYAALYGRLKLPINKEKIIKLYEMEYKIFKLISLDSSKHSTLKTIDRYKNELASLLPDLILAMKKVYAWWVNYHGDVVDPLHLLEKMQKEYPEIRPERLEEEYYDYSSGIITKHYNEFKKIEIQIKKEEWSKPPLSDILETYKMLQRGPSGDINSDMVMFHKALTTVHFGGPMMTHFANITGVSAELLNDLSAGKFTDQWDTDIVRFAKLNISKRAELVYGYWLSPEGKLHPVENQFAHKDFFTNNPDLLSQTISDNPADTAIYGVAFSEGWTRLVQSLHTLYVEVPSFDNKYLRLLQDVLTDIPVKREVIFSSGFNALNACYADVVSVSGFGELGRIERIASISKQASLPPIITAYHCGRKLEGNQFSTKYVGTGEGFSILGAGIYFNTNKDWAKPYAKYVDDPFLYTVEIDTSGIYNPYTGDPEHLKKKVVKLWNDVAKSMNTDRLPAGSSLTHGAGSLGDIARAVGTKQAYNMAKEIGVLGQYEELKGGYEISVFDPSIVKIIEVERLEKEKKASISKRAINYGWWLSPEGNLHPIGIMQHRDFVMKHPELFSTPLHPDLSAYERAFSKDWVRIAHQRETLFIELPSFDNKYLYRIQKALSALPVSETIITSFGKEFFKASYWDFSEARSFQELIHKEKFASRHISKLAESVYGYWLSPDDKLYPVEYEGHAAFIFRHQDLFGDVNEFGTYGVAYNNGWVRIVSGSNLHEISFSVPSLDDVYFNKIKKVLSNFTHKKLVLVSTKLDSYSVKTSYWDFVEAHSFQELIHKEKFASRSISKRSGGPKLSKRANDEFPRAMRNPPQQSTRMLEQMAKDPISKYKEKRDFDITKEPKGKAEKGGNKHRYVIQFHDAEKAGKHFDLRLENDEGSMTSWAVPKAKLPKNDEKLLATQTENHPIQYMEFGKGEGEEIKEGYGKGKVKIHSKGKYELIEWKKDTIKFKIPAGQFTLHRIDGKKWIFMKGAENEEKDK